MARIRSIKPDTFTSETLACCSLEARWTFAGLWCYVDDEARGRTNPGLIKAAVWPLDDHITIPDIENFLGELEDMRLICRYSVDGKNYLHVVNFGEHQHPNRPLPSKLPACSRRTHGGLSEDSAKAHSRPAEDAGNGSAASPEVITGKTGRRKGKAAGQGQLTEDTVSPHGGRRTKSSSIPPTPLRNEQGEGDGKGGEIQQASPAAANGLTPTQRAKPITDAYHEAQPMCKWSAINGIVVLAIKSGKYADGEIREAMLRMAKNGQTVTVESLRVEIEGLAPRNRPVDRHQAARDQKFSAAMARAVEADAREGRE